MQRQAQITHPDVQTSRCAQMVCLPPPNGDNKKASTAHKLSRQHLLHSNVHSINSGTDISICSLLENIVFLPTQGSNGRFPEAAACFRIAGPSSAQAADIIAHQPVSLLSGFKSCSFG